MDHPIKIAVLDSVPRKYWADDEGITDAQKFIELLGRQNSLAQFSSYYVSEHQFPESIDEYDGFMLTGSPVNVSEDFDWMPKLSELVVEADQKGKRIVASCFGHQLIAKTFGGEVSKNENGWMIGNYNLEIETDGQYEWMKPLVKSTGLYHFNQERVVRLPEGAQPFARSQEYPYFAYTLGDNILCMQGHPEQPKRAMNNFLKATPLPEHELKKARQAIDNGSPDSEVWGQWMMNFFLIGVTG